MTMTCQPGRQSADCGKTFMAYPVMATIVGLAGQYIMVARLHAIFDKAIWPIVLPM